MNASNSIPKTALLLAALGWLLSLSCFVTPAEAAASPTETANRKGISTGGKAVKVRSGPITVSRGRHLVLRFRPPSTWKNRSVDLVVRTSSSAPKGIEIRRAAVRWRDGAPIEVEPAPSAPAIRSGGLKAGATRRIDVSSLLSPGRNRSLRIGGAGGTRVHLERVPFLRLPRGKVIAAVGDVACSPESPDWNGGSGTTTDCRQAEVAGLVSGRDDAVLLLGDVQYPNGTLAQFESGFDRSWGGLAAKLRPAPGNHEYNTPGAAGYFDYFSALGVGTGDPSAGYYSFDLGGWTLLSLNSNCSSVACGAGSAQEIWFRERLEEARSAHRCTLAYWHHPPASSGWHGNQPEVAGLWHAFVELGGDVLLSGHDHHYERFAPLDRDLQPTDDGPIPWVVGTGGKDLRDAAGRTGTRKLIDDAFGLLRLRLWKDSFGWEWVGLEGVGKDVGWAGCRA